MEKILTKDAIKNIKKGDDDIIEKEFFKLLDHKKYIFDNCLVNGKVTNEVKYPIHIERITKIVSVKNRKTI